MCAENEGHSPLIANRNNLDKWETFTMEEQADQKCAIKSHANDKYVSLSHDNLLIANKTTISNTELFSITYLDGGSNIAIQSHANGHFVCADFFGFSSLKANRSNVLAWEKFCLIKL